VELRILATTRTGYYTGMRDAAEITGFHAHVYFDAATREKASGFREGLAGRFAVELGRWREGPIGPHTSAMYQVAFTPDQFANIVPWMMLNRGGLRVLVHPMTGDDVADHTSHPLWLGEPLPLDLDFIRAHASRSDLACRNLP
jgi:aromatic ring-cleaving dioxygenase